LTETAATARTDERGAMDAAYRLMPLVRQAGESREITDKHFPKRKVATFSEVVPRMSQRKRGRSGLERNAEGVPVTETNPDLEPWLARGYVDDLGAYHEMLRTNGLIGGTSRDRAAKIAGATWQVVGPKKPGPGEAEAVALVERFFGLGDYEGTGGWLIGGLREHLKQADMARDMGFVSFELTWQPQTWQWGESTRTIMVPGGVHLRAHNSVHGWLWKRDHLSGMLQLTSYERADGSLRLGHPSTRGLTLDGVRRKHRIMGADVVVIPSNRLLHYANGKQSAIQPEGVADIRPAWVWWRVGQDVLLRDQRARELYGEGLLVVFEKATKEGGPMATVSERDRRDMAETFGMVAVGESNFIQLPPGFDFKHLMPTGKMPDPLPMLAFCEGQIALTLSAQVYGPTARNTAGGSLSNNFSQIYLDYVANAAAETAGVINGQFGIEHTGLIRRLVHANIPEAVDNPNFVYPRITASGMAYKDPKGFVDAITKALQFRALHYSPGIEGLVRRVLDLPELSEDEFRMREEMAEQLLVQPPEDIREPEQEQGPRETEEDTQNPLTAPNQEPVDDPDDEDDADV